MFCDLTHSSSAVEIQLISNRGTSNHIGVWKCLASWLMYPSPVHIFCDLDSCGPDAIKPPGPSSIPVRPINADPRLKILFHFCLCLPTCMDKHSMLSSLSLAVKTKQYLVSFSDIFLDKKTSLKFGLILG